MEKRIRALICFNCRAGGLKCARLIESASLQGNKKLWSTEVTHNNKPLLSAVDAEESEANLHGLKLVSKKMWPPFTQLSKNLGKFWEEIGPLL